MSELITLNDRIKYHLYRRETDMRRSFDSLCGIVVNELGRRIQDGDAFIFINKHHTHLKLLVWEYGGFTIFYRKLVKGTFPIPIFALDARSLQTSATELLSMLKDVRLKR